MRYRTLVLLAVCATSCGVGRFGHPDEHDLYFHNDATESIFSLWYQVDGGEKQPLLTNQSIADYWSGSYVVKASPGSTVTFSLESRSLGDDYTFPPFSLKVETDSAFSVVYDYDFANLNYRWDVYDNYHMTKR